MLVLELWEINFNFYKPFNLCHLVMSEQTKIVVLIHIIILFDDCSHSYCTKKLREINKTERRVHKGYSFLNNHKYETRGRIKGVCTQRWERLKKVELTKTCKRQSKLPNLAQTFQWFYIVSPQASLASCAHSHSVPLCWIEKLLHGPHLCPST